MWKNAIESLKRRLCNVLMNSPKKKKIGHFGSAAPLF